MHFMQQGETVQKVAISQDEAILKALSKPLHTEVAIDLIDKLSVESLASHISYIIKVAPIAFAIFSGNEAYPILPGNAVILANLLLEAPEVLGNVFVWIVSHIPEEEKQQQLLKEALPKANVKGHLIDKIKDVEFLKGLLHKSEWTVYWKDIKFHLINHLFVDDVELTPYEQLSDFELYHRALEKIRKQKREKKSSLNKIAISEEEAILKALEKPLHVSVATNLLRRLSKEVIMKYLERILPIHTESFFDIMFDVGFSPEQFKEIAERALRMSPFPSAILASIVMHFEKDKEYSNYLANETLKHIPRSSKYGIFLVLQLTDAEQVYSYMGELRNYGTYWKHLIELGGEPMIKKLMHDYYVDNEDKFNYMVGQYENAIKEATPDFLDWLKARMSDRPNLFKAHILKYIKLSDAPEEEKKKLFEKYLPDSHWDPWILGMIKDMKAKDLRSMPKQAISSDEAILNALGKKPHVEVAKGLLDRISDSNKKIDAVHVIEKTYPEIQNAIALIDHLIYNIDRDLWDNRYQEFNNSKFDIKNLIQEWVTNAVALEILKNKAWWQVAEHLIYKRRDYNDFMQSVLFDKEIGITSRDFAYQYLSDDDKRVILPELVDRDIDYIKYKVKSPLGFKLLWDDIDNLNLPFEQRHISEKVLSVTPEDVKKSIFVDQPYLVRNNPETKASVNISAISRDEAIVKSLERPLSDEVALGLIQELSVESFKKNIDKIFPLYPDEALMYMRQATSLKGVDPSEFFLDVDFLKRVLDKKYEEELGSHQVGISYDITSKRNYQVNKELAKDPNILMESRLDFFNHLPDRLREEVIWEADDYGAMEFLNLLFIRRRLIENGFMNTLARSHPSANVRQYAEGLLETFKKEEGHGSKR